MSEFIVMSPCYEILRYGHDKIKNQVADAHRQGKLAKFVITTHDLIDPLMKPSIVNFKFELCQLEAVDVALFVKDGVTTVVKERN